MFSKRGALKQKKKDDDDEDDDGEKSPTVITVSIPQDAFDPHTNGNGSASSSRRSSFALESSRPAVQSKFPSNNNIQAHQTWKPWNPEATTQGNGVFGNRRSRSGSIQSITSPQLSTLSSPPASTTGGGSSSSLTNKSPVISSPTSAASQANSLMLNLTGLFTGSASSSSTPKSSTSGSAFTTSTTGSGVANGLAQPQPKEAQLWNADPIMSPPLLSPAGPRYISAIAGAGGAAAAAGSSAHFGGNRSQGSLSSASINGTITRSTNINDLYSPTLPNRDGTTRQWKSFGQQRQQPQEQQRPQQDLYQPPQSWSAASTKLTNGSRSLGLPTPGATLTNGPLPSPTLERVPEPVLSGSSSLSTATSTTTRSTRQKRGPERETNGRDGGMSLPQVSGHMQNKRWNNYHGSDAEDDFDHEGDQYSKEEHDRRYNRRRSKRNLNSNSATEWLCERLEGLFQKVTGRSSPQVLLRDPKRVLRARLFCLRQNRRLHPAVRLILLFFLVGSVCFTTYHLLFVEGEQQSRTRATLGKGLGNVREKGRKVKELLSKGKTGAGAGSGTETGAAAALSNDEDPALPKKTKVRSSFDVEALNYSNHQWNLETFDMSNSKAVVRIGEDYMLSKAYSGAMQPTRVIPFYFRASFEDENDDDDIHAEDGLKDHGDHEDQQSQQVDEQSPYNQETDFTPPSKQRVDKSLVTITTLITPDRYGVFLKLVRQYRGPISVATHIQRGEEQDRQLHELNQFFADHSILRKYVDLHVIVDGVDFQLNMWRNVARMFARTDYFMMLDVDFHIPSGLKNRLHHDPHIQQLLSSGAALVLPAFEYKLANDPKDSKYFPDTKLGLLPLLEKGHIHVFHDSFPPGHAATDTPRWIKMSEARYKEQQRLEAAGKAPPPRTNPGYDDDDDFPAAIPAEAFVPAGGDNSKDRSLFVEHEHQAKLKEDKEREEAEEAAREKERQEFLELEAEGERPYKVTKFEPKYEPYIILKREGTPWCDERFVGYGANKAACLFEIYISGIDFWVLPQDFLIHQWHDYPTTNRKNGRILNKQLFVSFQQEICFATLRRMIKTGEWYTDKAANLRHQCGAFEGFLKSADQLANDFEMTHPNSLLQDPVFVLDIEKEDSTVNGGDSNKDSSGSEIRNRLQDHEIHAIRDQHAVDDEDVQDPFLSPRLKGKTWGGIKIRTFYVPPPPEEGESSISPIEGGGDLVLGGDDAVALGTALAPGQGQGDGTVTNPGGAPVYEGEQYQPQINGDDLIGERLEKFRQGIILDPVHGRDGGGVDSNSNGVSNQSEGSGSIPGNEAVVVQHKDSTGSEGGGGGDSNNQGGRLPLPFGQKILEMGSRSPSLTSSSTSSMEKENSRGDNGNIDDRSFEEAAIQLEERVIQLGLA